MNNAKENSPRMHIEEVEVQIEDAMIPLNMLIHLSKSRAALEIIDNVVATMAADFVLPTLESILTTPSLKLPSTAASMADVYADEDSEDEWRKEKDAAASAELS